MQFLGKKIFFLGKKLSGSWKEVDNFLERNCLFTPTLRSGYSECENLDFEPALKKGLNVLSKRFKYVRIKVKSGGLTKLQFGIIMGGAALALLFQQEAKPAFS